MWERRWWPAVLLSEAIVVAIIVVLLPSVLVRGAIVPANVGGPEPFRLASLFAQPINEAVDDYAAVVTTETTSLQGVSELEAQKDVFLADEPATFHLPAQNDAAHQTIEKVVLVNHHGTEIDLPTASFVDDVALSRTLSIQPRSSYKPGRYTLRVRFADPEGVTITEEQDFAWGVLVINPGTSIALPGEEVTLGMAALDYTGKTLCEADLFLIITSPSGVETTRSTADGSITKSYDCDVHSVTNLPDYSTLFTPDELGTYALKLSSDIKAGEKRTGYDDAFSIEDSFDVRASVPFAISRENTPTRLYPIADYQTTITITANENWDGLVYETLPSSFSVYDISGNGVLSSGDEESRQVITWDARWQAGETHTFTYWFNPPNPSPRVYGLGPFTVGAFQESRQWQLAADATRVWDGGAAVANWSNAANWDGDNTLVANDTVVFDASAGGTPNDASQWNAAAPQTIDSLTMSSYTNTLTYNRDDGTVTNAFSFTAAGTVAFQSGDTHHFGGNFTFTSGTMTTTGATQIMEGNGSTINATGTFAGTLTIGNGSDTINTATNDFTVTGTLTTANASDILSIGSSRSVTVGSSGSSTNNGTISGSGTLIWASSTTITTGGTISSRVRFDATGADRTVAARTYGGVVEAYSNSTTNARSVVLGTAGSQTITFSSDVNVLAADSQTTTLTGAANNPAVNITGSVDFTGVGAGSEAITTGTGTWTIAGNIDFSDGTISATTNNTVVMTGTSNSITGNTQQFYNLTIDTATNNGTITAAGGFFVNSTMNVGTGDTLSISTSIVVQHTGATLTLDGTLSGAGEFDYYSATAVPTTGTINVNFAMFAANNDQTLSARTYGGDLRFYHNSGSARQVVIASGTVTVGGNITFLELGAGTYELSGVTNNPTVDVAGFFAVSGGTPAVVTGTGTWSFAAGANLTNAIMTFTSGNTFQLDGTGSFTSDSETLQNFAITAGTVTLANATHTVAGNLNLAGGTVTAGTSTVTMTGTSNTITGGGVTLANLTIDPATTGTITLQTSNLIASATLTVAAGDTLSINSGITLTHTGATLTWGDSASTISGAGTLRFTSGSGGPGTGGVISSITRYDATSADVASTTFDARTYSGRVEIYSSSTTARSVRAANATYTLSGSSSHFYVVADGASPGDVTFDGATNNPTMTIGGDVDFTGTGSSSEIITSGTATWTVSGHVDLSNGTYTAATGNTILMDGTKNLIGNSQSLYNLTINGNGNTVTVATSNVSVTNTLTIGGAADSNNDTLDIASGISLTSTSAGTVTFVASGTDSITGSGRLIVANSNLDTDGTLSSIVRFLPTAGTSITMPARTYGGLVEVVNSSGLDDSSVIMAAGTHVLSGSLNLLATSASNITLDGATNAATTVTITGDLDYTGVGAGSEFLTTRTSSTWTVSGSVDFTGGTYTAASGNTLAMNGTSKTLTSASQSLHNFTVSGGSVSSADTLDVDNDLSITGGAYTAPSTLTIGGSFDNDAAFTHSSGTVTFNATSGTKTIDADGTGAEAFNNLTFNDAGGSGQWDLSTTLDADNNLTITGGIFNISTNNINVGGNWDNDDTLSFSSATVTFDAASGTKTIDARGLAAPDFFNVIFNDGGGSATFELATAMDVNNTLTITGGTLDTKSGSSFQINVGLSWFNADTFTPRLGTVIFDCANFSLSPVIDSTGASAASFYDLTFSDNDANVLFTLESALDVDHDLTITGESEVDTKVGEDNAITVGRNWANDGYFDAQNGTVTFDGSTTQTLSGSMTGLSPFHNFIITNSSGSVSGCATSFTPGIDFAASATINSTYTITTGGAKVEYNSGDTYTATNINWNGSGNDIVFRNSNLSSGTWLLDVSGTQTAVSSVNVARSDASLGDEINASDGTNTDCGDNTNWRFGFPDLTLSVSDNTMDLGVLNPLVVGSDSHTITVTTNATNGYTCKATEDGNLRNGANDIDDVIGGSVDAGSEEYGISCTSGGCQLTGDNAVSGTPLTVASNPAAATAEATTVTYKAAVTAATAGTQYANIVTFTCTGNF